MFRFTARDLLWLTALVAMGIAWWIDIRRRDSSITAAQLRVAEAEFKVDRARSETIAVREQDEARYRNVFITLMLERAKTDPQLRAEFEKAFPEHAKRLLSPDSDP